MTANRVEETEIQCPYCWEMISILVDCSVAEQEYIEDCEVCCRPIVMSTVVDGDGTPRVIAASDES